MAKTKNLTKKVVKGILGDPNEEITYVGAMVNVGVSIHRPSPNGGGPITIVKHKKTN